MPQTVPARPEMTRCHATPRAQLKHSGALAAHPSILPRCLTVGERPAPELNRIGEGRDPRPCMSQRHRILGSFTYQGDAVTAHHPHNNGDDFLDLVPDDELTSWLEPVPPACPAFCDALDQALNRLWQTVSISLLVEQLQTLEGTLPPAVQAVVDQLAAGARQLDRSLIELEALYGYLTDPGPGVAEVAQ